jgi:hypothetical protein
LYYKHIRYIFDTLLHFIINSPSFGVRDFPIFVAEQSHSIRYEIAVISCDFKILATALEFVLLSIERSVPALGNSLQLATAVFFLLAGRRPEFAKVCLMAASKVSSSQESS